MRRIYEYSQSDDPFAKEPQGVCLALSSQWIVARAKWRADGGTGTWSDASWMGPKNKMAEHVDRIYTALRAARTSVDRQLQTLMAQELDRFNQEKTALVKQQRRRATNKAALVAADDASPAIPGYSNDDLVRRFSQIDVPSLPRMLDAVRKDIAGQANLVGAVHSYDAVQSTAAGAQVCSLDVGYNLIDVRDSHLAEGGGAHAIAAEISSNETRLFDPNYGEWLSVPPTNARTSLSTQLGFMLQSIYSVSSIQTLSVIHFRPA
jgi:hypothetical protein